MERNRRGYQFAVALLALALACVAAAALMRPSREQAPAEEAPAQEIAAAAEGLYRTSATELSQQPLEQEAAARLAAYRDGGQCRLACAGYLDLHGQAWGCVVAGDGWVEVLVVKAAAEGGSSVQTIRFQASP